MKKKLADSHGISVGPLDQKQMDSPSPRQMGKGMGGWGFAGGRPYFATFSITTDACSPCTGSSASFHVVCAA